MITPPARCRSFRYLIGAHAARAMSIFPLPDRCSSTAARRLYAESVSGRRGLAAIGGPRIGIVEITAPWLDSLDGVLDPLTIDAYEMYAVRHWAPFFVTFERITAATVNDFWRARLRVVQRGTVKKELSALRGFLRWAKEREYITEIPVVEDPPERSLGVRSATRNPKGAPLELTREQVDAVLKALPEWSAGGGRGPRFRVRDRFVVAYETALRPATLDEIEAPGDYRRGAATLVIRDAIDKARFGREVPLSPRAREVLDAITPTEGLVFGHHDYRALLKAAGATVLPPEMAPRLSPYDFRHARLTHWAERSSNLAGIAFLAGHKHLSTTDHYLHASARAASDVLSAAAGAGQGRPRPLRESQAPALLRRSVRR